MYIEPTFDEFNSYPVVNFFSDFYGRGHKVVTFKGYECLYPFFKSEDIITIEQPTELHKLSTDDRQAIIALNMPKDFISAAQAYSAATTEHIYKYLFSNYTKFLIHNKTHMFTAPKEDLDYVSELYSKISRPIVCINGRNLSKHTDQNNLMKKEIGYLISSGYFVINCTLNQPNFDFNSECYLEPGIEELKSYNRTLAYFTLAKSLISVARNSGITTHIMSNANIIMYGIGGYVDNSDFGHDRESIYSARRKYLPYKITEHVKSPSQLIDLLSTF